MKRDIQGKFALKNDDYRSVRSLRLTDDTWRALGVIAECLGLTRADYLEEIVSRNLLPSITPSEAEHLPSVTPLEGEHLPSITRYEQEIERLKAQVQNLQENNSEMRKGAAFIFIQDVVNFETIRDRILFELKLGRQANGYKTAQKALNRLIAELKLLATRL
ncbi:hypothetical protein [Brasilonema bromeliae]|uniref:Uncharacterized protein n=1 Tax=Brasilonema bromeliae SPC951 TaxID=385972 RepID=A0ABX1P158_9CYAN|nr:hypothetical protein [Brasilonema bromeliae]NMG18024.1 hypothetical protein [Brasilonema bromeliae SPC951]